MKHYKEILTALLIGLITTPAICQTMQNDKETFTIEGEYYFMIIRKDLKTQKVIKKYETKIPDKENKEAYYVGNNNTNFRLIGDEIVIIYDVWQKKTSTKDCFVKTLDLKKNQFSEPKILYSEKLNSAFSSGEVIYKPVYSPDLSKVVILKDNISPTYDIKPEVTIYDTKTFAVLSNTKLSDKYQNQKRVIGQDLTMDNAGNIMLNFSLMNEETKMTTKKFTAEIAFKGADMENIKEMEGAKSGQGTAATDHGLLYKTMQDYIDDKPIKGMRIKNGSFSWTTFGGTDYKVIDDQGNIRKEDAKDLGAEVFTYKSSSSSPPWLIRLIDKKPYIVLTVGELCFYSMYASQQSLSLSEGWNGKLIDFSASGLKKKYLEKKGLGEQFEKDKPKREFKDDVNGYFNKQVAWYLKYVELYNKTK